MANSDFLPSIERQERLAELLRKKQRITVAEVCDAFDVSVATARRDLDAITEQGRAQRVHGGAIVPKAAPPEGPATQRVGQRGDQKRRIGKAAAELVRPGETIIIGSGTTAVEVARNITNVSGLTVITNSLLVVNLLAQCEAVTVVCLGGVLRNSEMSLIGHITEQSLAEVRASKVIMGIHAIDIEQGLTNDHLPEAMSDRVILKAAREAVVVADSTKCGTVSAGFVAPLEAVHTLVTDTEVAPEFVRGARACGVEVVTV